MLSAESEGSIMAGRLLIVALALTIIAIVADHGLAQEGLTQAGAATEVVMAKSDLEPFIGGCGGVYFLAEPGELIVEVAKRDRNARETISELRAILVGPDRAVLDEQLIPDDGAAVGSGLGAPQSVTLRATVTRPGIYGLNVTVSQDRYGDHMVWGFRTNCPKYLIETARGHRDRRHEEPIVLASPERPATVCFQPRQGAFNISLSGLPANPAPITVSDANGEQLGQFSPAEDGTAAWTAPADVHRDAVPWQLRLPAAKGVAIIEGVTIWEKIDPIPDRCHWTPDPASWFPLIENRWLLTPYQRTIYADAGEQGELAMRVHNNAEAERSFSLGIEFPGAEWPVSVEPAQVTLGPREASEVTVRYTVPEGAGPRQAHIRVTPADTPAVSTWSTLTIKPGTAPAASLLEMPIELTPYSHENEQFGYLPDYPLENQVYFAPDNTPYMRNGQGVATFRDGRWVTTEINSAMTAGSEAFAGQAVSLTTTKIGFDADGGLYLTANCAGKNAIVYSGDGARTFTAYEVPGAAGGMDIENFSGQNTEEGPPAFVRTRRTAKDPNLIWRSLSDLELFVPQWVDGKLVMGEPILLTRECIGFSGHSGMPSSVVSRGSKVHVTWGIATDPEAKAPGVPTYCATYDIETGTLGEPALLGYGPPANDGHNTPSITMDRDGYLHVLIGTHGRPFHHCQSLKPEDAGGGWTEPLTAGEGFNQTYIGMVCSDDGTLHVVYRLWRTGEPFPNSSHATLAYQRKLPGKGWEQPRILVRAAFSEYSVFYHRLTIDHRGRLFISYDYWSTHWFYRNDHVGNRRTVLMSPDTGETWKLAETRDLVGP